MKQIIDTLNEMSFELPSGFELSNERYKLPNGQGFKNKANYISPEGGVISLFEIHRDPDEFFEYYDKLTSDYDKIQENTSLLEKCNLKIGEFLFPTYILKCFEQKIFFIVQVFVNCGDCLGCFMINTTSFTKVSKEIKSNPLLSQLVKILRSIE